MSKPGRHVTAKLHPHHIILNTNDNVASNDNASRERAPGHQDHSSETLKNYPAIVHMNDASLGSNCLPSMN